MDSENSAVRLGNLPDLPENLVRNVLSNKLQIFLNKSPSSKLLIIPSLQDLCHDNTFPQCSFPPNGVFPPTSLLGANPCLLTINNTTFSLSSEDALLHLGLHEISKGQQTDRIARLCSHLFNQASFSPIIPSQSNLDYNVLEAVEMQCKPDILIVPSALRHFAKMVEGSVVVNPGQYCKKQAFGSCAVITVLPGMANCSERCRVDIVQF